MFNWLGRQTRWHSLFTVAVQWHPNVDMWLCTQQTFPAPPASISAQRLINSMKNRQNSRLCCWSDYLQVTFSNRAPEKVCAACGRALLPLKVKSLLPILIKASTMLAGGASRGATGAAEQAAASRWRSVTPLHHQELHAAATPQTHLPWMYCRRSRQPSIGAFRKWFRVEVSKAVMQRIISLLSFFHRGRNRLRITKGQKLSNLQFGKAINSFLSI